MPEGKISSGDFRQGTPINLPALTFGTPVNLVSGVRNAGSPEPPVDATYDSNPVPTPNPNNDSNVIYTNPPVFIESITPTSGLAAGSTSVTINGTGFRTGATVLFGANSATSVVIVSSTQITCATPAGSNTQPPVRVVVTNTDTQYGLLGNAFTYE